MCVQREAVSLIDLQQNIVSPYCFHKRHHYRYMEISQVRDTSTTTACIVLISTMFTDVQHKATLVWFKTLNQQVVVCTQGLNLFAD